MRRALVLGTHSFIDGGSKVGMQHLAEGLARHGWQVDYVATSSSPFDLWGRQRHARLRRVWLQSQAQHGVVLEKGLTEYAFKALFPAHKMVLRSRWQLQSNTWLAPAWLRTREYDVCLHEASPQVLYFPLCRARVRIFRLADWPDGFAHEMPAALIERFGRQIAESAYDEIWAVSQPLAQYALDIRPDSPVLTMPNGVESFFEQPPTAATRAPNSAIFLGGRSAWFDADLVHAAARHLPDWRIDLVGPGATPQTGVPANVHHRPPVPREQVPGLLAQYEVGLVPLRESHGRMRFVERPLKFYEYVSAGLGVASTDIGGLRSGMGEWARYGNTAQAFAQAIVAAREDARQRTPQDGLQFMREHAWDTVVARALQRIEALLARQPP